MAEQQQAFIDARQDNPGTNASKNIINIINAMADARTAQTELQKQIMLKQIGDKMDLQQNAAKLHQGVESNIDQKNANLNWVNSLSGQDTPASSTDNGLGQSGTADSGTPASVGGPQVQGQGNPMASAINPAAPPPASPTPMLTAAAQPQPNPAPLNGVVPPAVNSQNAIPSPQYQNLGYKPVEPQQILAQRQANGQSPNVADAHYVQALNKVKAGTATNGELGMVHTMNNRDTNGNVYPQAAKEINDNISPFQKGILTVKAKMGPQFTLDGNGEVVTDPQWKALMDAKAAHEAGEPDRQQARQDRLYNQAVNDIATKQVSYRSGSIGLQDLKVSQAIHARQLLNQAYDQKTGNFDVTQVPYGELSESLGSLLAGSTGSSEGRINALKQRTAAGDINGIGTYIFGKPTNAAPQDILKQLVSMIDRQGTTAEDIRDGDIGRLKHAVLDGSGLDDKRKQDMFNSPPVGASYKDLLKQSPDQQSNTGGNITMTSPSGKTYTFSADQADEARKNGWK